MYPSCRTHKRNEWFNKPTIFNIDNRGIQKETAALNIEAFINDGATNKNEQTGMKRTLTHQAIKE